ncbi:hypothetical protein GOP47_0010434 [Adiantum capillus-veneris]|uniref:Phytocyanin domain-containing protein n=1 Tax=Adiantum capillus-veneris TaxID=13818 RepID=A0A9D4UUQ7_ADICA|nr:hypothetical protein GOP47_0010434 [Adiantum capillus-veneris]
MDKSGHTIFGPLQQQVGIYHFTCGHADHCDKGMKLGIYVDLLPGHPSEAEAAAASPASSAVAAPSTPSSYTFTPAPTPPDLDYPTPPLIDYL